MSTTPQQHKYTQIIIDKDANTGKYNAHTFAHICLFDPKKHIKGNTCEILTEHHLNNNPNLKTRYQEKHARIATLSTFTLDKLTEAVAWLALGCSRQRAIEMLADAYSRVTRNDVGTEQFAFIVFETVEITQAETTANNTIATPQAASTPAGSERNQLQMHESS